MRTLITNALVFDGEAWAEDGAALLIDGAEIKAIAPLKDFSGIDANIVDASGQTLLPGLIDAHVHLCFGSESNILSVIAETSDAQAAIRAVANAQATLRGGVTSVRDLGGLRHIDCTLREEIARGSALGPSLRASARMICITGGHGFFIGAEADGVDGVRKAVRANIKAGADTIKMIATGGVMTPNTDPLTAHFSAEELRAGIEEATRFGRKVAVHALGRQGVINAVEAGAASIEHGFELDTDIIKRMIDKDIVLVPTLSAIGVCARAQYAGLPPAIADRARRFADMQRASVRAFYEAGGKIAMGTDAGTPLNYHGQNAQELGFLAELGVSTTDALKAATAIGADLCGFTGRGRLRPGAYADVLLVKGDARRDISRVAEPQHHTLVLKEGHDVERLVGHSDRTRFAPINLEQSPF